MTNSEYVKKMKEKLLILNLFINNNNLSKENLTRNYKYLESAHKTIGSAYAHNKITAEEYNELIDIILAMRYEIKNQLAMYNKTK